MRSSLRIGGSSSTTRILAGAALMRSRSPAAADFGTGRLIVNAAPLRSVRFAAAIVPPHGLHEAARDGQAEPRAGPHLVALLHPVELVEDALQVVRRNALALVQHLQAHGVLVAPALDAHRRLRARILGGVVEQVEQRLLEQHGIHHHHRQAGRRSRPPRDAAPGSCSPAPARCRRSRPHPAAPRSAPRRPIRAWSCRAGWR